MCKWGVHALCACVLSARGYTVCTCMFFVRGTLCACARVSFVRGTLCVRVCVACVGTLYV